ncbi:MAG: CarD family transcriptional regulator [Oscillospiraceae bacterium]
MYQVGDFILYGSTGVCRVTDIVTRDLAGVGKKQLYYVLNPLYQNCVISTPVNATKVFTRPIITKDEAERLIDTIPTIRAEAYHSRIAGQLSEHYEASLKTHDCADLIELTMSIYAKKKFAEQQKRKFGSIDERFMKCAEELLYGELAAALAISKDKVPEYIAERVNGKQRENIDEFNE